MELAPKDPSSYYMLGLIYSLEQIDESKAESMLIKLKNLEEDLYLDLYNRVNQ